MLVLTRNVGERLVFETPTETITVMIDRITHGKVRLAIDAPQSVRISRAELQNSEDIRHAPRPD